jgi:hypothetical protein
MEIITPSQAREAGRNLGLKLVEADQANSEEMKEFL